LSPSIIAVKVFEFVILLFSLSFHECAHAWMASRLGDQTARMEGRVTLNPMYHIDPIGTLLFPALVIFGPLIGFTFFSGFLVGWAKPTPVITRNFKRIVRDDNLVTLAGPASNLLLVLVAFLIMAVTSVVSPAAHNMVMMSFLAAIDRVPATEANPALMICSLLIIINFSLLFFNLFPIPPLDGSHLLRNSLPYNALQKYDRIPFWVSYLLMIFVGGFILSLLLGPSLGLVFAALMSL
jgi:Zn-dependent protease